MTTKQLQLIEQAGLKIAECAITAKDNMEMREFMESRLRDWFDRLDDLMLDS